ncbi:hexokinase-like [Chironomus tepperi]|uniref:hexokinase-like n=1 Tax=Chironomus tepperi TaxID=113505 RepID=UPI00391FB3F9
MCGITINNQEGNYKVEDLKLKDAQRATLVKELLRKLILNKDQIHRVGEAFKDEMRAALGEQKSSLQMENTYIPELPDGTEEGTFLALDLGGTNFRVILLELARGQILKEEFKFYHISDEARLGCGIELFDYLADCVKDFMGLKEIPIDSKMPMGFTFSFPMKQHSLHSAELVTWTKSFNCPSVVGRDVVELLQNSLKKHGMENIEVLCILNDTTGTLVEGARLDKKTRIGMILGTGSNAAFLERAERVQHWEGERHNEKHVIIDIEWGAFGDKGTIDFIRTEYDKEVDNGSLLKNSFTFEKYISGKYLGEVCRVVLRDLVDKGLLFSKASKELFPAPWKFGTDNVSHIEEDALTGSNTMTVKVFDKFNYKFNEDYDEDDIKLIQYATALVSYRAALLVSICTAVLLNRMNEKDITIAVDGSVYKHHPRLKRWMKQLIKELAPEKEFHLMLAEDGSGKGAGLVSSIAQRINARNDETPITTAHTVNNDHKRHHHQVNGCAKVHTNGVNGFHNGKITSAVNGHTNGYSNGH